MPEYHPLFLLALRTGPRLGEILAVHWNDIDFAGRFIEVRRSLVGGRVTSTKNTNRRRVDMSLKLTEALRDHKTAQRPRASRLAGAYPRGSSPIPTASHWMVTTCATVCPIRNPDATSESQPRPVVTLSD